MYFGTNSATRVIIDAAGSVGVGTTSPSYSLDVAGSARLYSASSNTALFLTKTDATNAVKIDSSGSSWFSGGNVGIGTTNPQSTLHVNGGVQMGADLSSCVAAKVGTLRYNAGTVEFCNGSAWGAVSAGGVLSKMQGTGYSTSTSGALVGRTLSFTKSNAASVLKLEYTDTIGIYGPAGSMCAFEIKIDGASCSTPVLANAYTYVTSGSGGDMYPGIVAGYCAGVSAGAHTATVNVTSTGSPISCYAGYNNAVFTLSSEELGAVSSSSGVGTANKIALWGAGNTLSDSVIAQSGTNVGIGTTNPISPLTVNGVIESKSGGIKFPDGTIQTTANLTPLSNLFGTEQILNFGQNYVASSDGIVTALGVNASAQCVVYGYRNSVSVATSSNQGSAAIETTITFPVKSGETWQVNSGNFNCTFKRLSFMPANGASGNLWNVSGGTINYLAGNVGIGTTSPASKLSIGGTAGVDGIGFPDGTVQTTALGGGVGIGQTWQNVLSQRTAGTTYTNSTGKPIFVSVYQATQGAYFAYVSGIAVANIGAGSGTYAYGSAGFIVPAGATYSISSGASISIWAELR